MKEILVHIQRWYNDSHMISLEAKYKTRSSTKACKILWHSSYILRILMYNLCSSAFFNISWFIISFKLELIFNIFFFRVAGFFKGVLLDSFEFTSEAIMGSILIRYLYSIEDRLSQRYYMQDILHLSWYAAFLTTQLLAFVIFQTNILKFVVEEFYLIVYLIIFKEDEGKFLRLYRILDFKIVLVNFWTRCISFNI